MVPVPCSWTDKILKPALLQAAAALEALLVNANFGLAAGPQRLAPELATGLLFLAIPLMEAEPGLFGEPAAILMRLEVRSSCHRRTWAYRAHGTLCRG